MKIMKKKESGDLRKQFYTRNKNVKKNKLIPCLVGL